MDYWTGDRRYVTPTELGSLVNGVRASMTRDFKTVVSIAAREYAEHLRSARAASAHPHYAVSVIRDPLPSPMVAPVPIAEFPPSMGPTTIANPTFNQTWTLAYGMAQSPPGYAFLVYITTPAHPKVKACSLEDASFHLHQFINDTVSEPKLGYVKGKHLRLSLTNGDPYDCIAKVGAEYEPAVHALHADWALHRQEKSTSKRITETPIDLVREYLRLLPTGRVGGLGSYRTYAEYMRGPQTMSIITVTKDSARFTLS